MRLKRVGCDRLGAGIRGIALSMVCNRWLCFRCGGADACLRVKYAERLYQDSTLVLSAPRP